MSKRIKSSIMENENHIVWLDRLLMDALRAGHRRPSDVLEYIIIRSEEKAFDFVKANLEKINAL